MKKMNYRIIYITLNYLMNLVTRQQKKKVRKLEFFFFFFSISSINKRETKNKKRIHIIQEKLMGYGTEEEKK